MKPCWSRIAVIAGFVFLFLLLPLAEATPPGKTVAPTEQKEVSATLFLVGIHWKTDGTINSLEFAWLPKAIGTNCLGMTLADASALDHQRRQKTQDARRWHPFGPTPPTRLLTAIVSDRAFVEEARRMPVIGKLLSRQGAVDQNSRQDVTISPDTSLETKVKWELWPNGENFAVPTQAKQ